MLELSGRESLQKGASTPYRRLGRKVVVSHHLPRAAVSASLLGPAWCRTSWV